MVLLLGVACLVVAAVYAFIWPRPTPGVTRPVWRALILRWGHSAVWLLLGLSFFMRNFENESVAAQANVIALPGGALYAVATRCLNGGYL